MQAPFSKLYICACMSATKRAQKSVPDFFLKIDIFDIHTVINHDPWYVQTFCVVKNVRKSLD